MSNNTVLAAKNIMIANSGQASQAMLIQQYANSINEQPTVDFSGFDHLLKYQSDINTGLITAQTHANTYLHTIQPNIITNIAQIGNYYALHNAVATTLPPGTSKSDWIAALTALSEQSKEYEDNAKGVVISIQKLHDGLTTDASAFAKVVSELNAAVNGDGGTLSSINDQLSTIQSQIDGAIAGAVVSGLAIVGGVFMIAVGGVGEFVTAGTSTPLLIGGIAVVAAGIGGEVASAIALKNLNAQKATLLQEKSTLTAEVNIATGIGGAYGSLGNQVKSAVDAASAMQNAWNFLSSDLDTLSKDLDKGILSTGEIQKIFLTAAQTEVNTIISDITTIKTQMTSPKIIAVEPGQTVGDAIVKAAEAHTLAA